MYHRRSPEAVGWAVPSARAAAVADDGDIAPTAVVGTDIVPAAAGSWGIADTAALLTVMGILVVAKTAAAAVAMVVG